jgi:hypothetical protein
MSNDSSSRRMDVAQLPADTFGLLLPLLLEGDVQSMRLTCQPWQQAVDQQLRTIRPLYLPAASPAVFSSCEAVDAPVVRRVEGVPGNTDSPSVLTWQAPIRDLSSLSTTLGHAAVLDLSGQQLPPGSIMQHINALTRLRSLRLDACTLSTDDLVRGLRAFAHRTASAKSDQGVLTHVSLSAVQLRAQHSSHTRSSPTAAPGAAADASSVAAALAESEEGAAAGSSADWAGNGWQLQASVESCILHALACNPLTKLELQGSVKVGRIGSWLDESWLLVSYSSPNV